MTATAALSSLFPLACPRASPCSPDSARASAGRYVHYDRQERASAAIDADLQVFPRALLNGDGSIRVKPRRRVSCCRRRAVSSV